MTLADHIPAGKYCCDIDGQSVSTADEHLAHIYDYIRRMAGNPDNAATPWFFILECLPTELRGFAERRDIADDPLLLDVGKRFNLAQEIYEMDETDADTVRGILTGCVADLQYLDSHARPAETATPPDDDADDTPPIELKLVAVHRTRDMSVAGGYEEKLLVPYKDLRTGRTVDCRELGCGRMKVLDVSETHIRLRWGDEELALDIGGKTTVGPFLVDNPMLSVDEVTLTLEYWVIPLYYQALDVVLRVSREHEKEFRSVYPATTRLEERALRLLDRAIAGGMIEAYPLKALLEASNNWATCVIVRPGLFRLVLLEGIGLGCLAPDKTLAWEWMETAAVNNDPATFMDDMDRYYDLLADAAENGVAEARRLMDRIWEPEQIIEED